MRRRFTSNIDNAQVTPLYIEALEDGVKFSADYDSGILRYSVDGKGYTTIPPNTFTESINKGSRFYIKGDKCFFSSTYPRFSIKGKCKIGGSVHSPTFGDSYSTITSSGNCPYMFMECDIVEVENDFLKYTTLAPSCYYYMFRGCTSLQTAPALPATTLADSCYACMFSYCTSLTTAPELPATKLPSACYYYMFYGCSNLNYIKMLATDKSGANCLLSWVRDIASTGTFVKNPAMTSLPTGNSGIPSGWTVVNDGAESGGGNLIVFTILSHSGISYQYRAQEGMTWGEWIESEYNTDGYWVDVDDTICLGGVGNSSCVGTTSEDFVLSSDVIVEGYQYLLMV